MKLNEQQVAVRHAFRQHVLSMWGQGKAISDVIIATARSCNIATKDAWSIAESVPSIGKLYGKTRIDVWVGHSYPKVSEALFNNDRRAAETLFIAKTINQYRKPAPKKRQPFVKISNSKNFANSIAKKAIVGRKRHGIFANEGAPGVRRERATRLCGPARG